MNKTYTIKVNPAKGDATAVEIPQTVLSGKPTTVKAVSGSKYQLIDPVTGFAPQNIRASRSDKNLLVFFEGRSSADLIIEDYYEATDDVNALIGEAESGLFYEYIPESAVGFTTVPMLSDGLTPVGMALGGSEVFGAGAAVGALIGGGFSPLLLAPLALLGLGGGSDPVPAAPPEDKTPPTIASGKLLAADDSGAKDNVTSDTTPRIAIQTEKDAKVSVVLNGVTYTGTADANGVFEVQVTTPLKSDVTYTPVITAIDAAGNSTGPVNGTPFKIDSAAPIIASAALFGPDDRGARGDNITSDTTPRIEIKTEKEANVSVVLNNLTYTGTADANGVFLIQVQPGNELVNGVTYTPVVTATDATGNTTGPVNGTPFSIDTSPPLVATRLHVDDDSGLKGDHLTNDTTPRIQVMTDPLVSVTVGLNGKTYSGTSDANGIFEILVPSDSALTPGQTYTPVVTVTDGTTTVGPVNGTPFKIDNAAPVIASAQLLAADDSSTRDHITSDTTPRIAIQTEKDAKVSMVLNGVTYTGTADANGVFEVQVTVPLTTDVTYTPKVTATDAAGNSTGPVDGTPFKIDNAAPAIASAQLLAADDSSTRDHITSDTTPRIAIQTEKDAKVSVELNGVTYTGTADANGVFEVQVTVPLTTDVTYTPKVTATDAAGNSTGPVNGTPFKIDNVAPAIVSAQLLAADDSGVKDNITSDTIPRIVIQTEKDAKVSVELNDVTYTGTADANGVFEVQVTAPLTHDVTYTPKVTATDAAGNSTGPMNGTPFKIDNVAPAIVSAQLFTGDDSGPRDHVTSDTTPRIDIQTEKDANVSVVLNNVTYTGVANADGVFTLQVLEANKLVNGQTYTPVVTATDGAGNPAPVFNGTPFKVVTEVTGPNKSANISIQTITRDTGVSDTDWDTSDTTLTFKGGLTGFTAVPGDTVRLSLTKAGFSEVAYVTPVQTGNLWGWTWDLGATKALLGGTYQLTASIVDGADNVFGSSAPKTLIIDTEGPTNVPTVTITGVEDNSGFGGANHPSRKDFKTNDVTPGFKGNLDKVLTPDQWIEVQLFDKDNKLIQSDYVRTDTAQTTQWTWSPEWLNVTLVDGIYTVKAQVVDISGNPAVGVAPVTQELIIDTIGPNDPIDPNDGFKVSSLKIRADRDTGLHDDDFVTKAGGTQQDLLVFEGTLANSDNTALNQTFLPNSETQKLGGSVLVQVVDRTTGAVATEGQATLSGNSWSFAATQVVAPGDYILKVSLLDHVANRVSSMDHLMVVDRNTGEQAGVNGEIKAFAAGYGQANAVSLYWVGAVEKGQYSVDGMVGGTPYSLTKEYSGGFFNLNELKGKDFGDTFKLTFTDIAGNNMSVTDNLAFKEKNFSTSSSLSNSSFEEFPLVADPGHTLTNPKTVGNAGSLVLTDATFDMSVLYDGIANLTNLERAATNHVDLTHVSAQLLELSVQDVLALGVTDSFSATGNVQMRIDAGANDTIQFLNELGATPETSWTVNTTNTVQLQGVTGNYYLASNAAFDVEVFVKAGTQHAVL